ncbi:hypothetical protein [Thioflexithrix psekupsensis]|uniref:Uncharacterized protein n=1 Tax=Thioflexithrix psekupsensis TaxID=1570016 RepID=A0A251XB01_9GAMM|nr:hypothetical protein [Thioflexithrix psekupsensis]OUD15483.1 hypothetical protein TPSD3_02860 [Thioflexithrix psekupsensis]
MLSPHPFRYSFIITLTELPVTICVICYWKAFIGYFAHQFSRSWTNLKNEYKEIAFEYEESENAQNIHEATRAVIMRELSPDAFGDEYDWR